MSVFKVEGPKGSQSQTITFEEIRYSGQCISVPKVGGSSPPPGNSFLLLEDGSFILLEDGGKIILE